MLPGHAVGHFEDGNVLGHQRPVGVGGQAEELGGGGGVAQVYLGGGVGEGVVVHVFGPLVGGHHVLDVVVAGAVALHPAGPEISSCRQNGPAFLAQPGPVLRHAVVLPGGQGHVGRDVVLKRPAERPDRRFLHARVGAFPREHGALVAVGEGIAASRLQPPEAVLDQRLRNLRMQHGQGREHPQISIPEHVAVVAEPREAHGRGRVVGAGPREAVEVVHHAVHVLLRLRIAGYLNVAFPQFVPGLGVEGQQALLAFEAGEDGEALGLVERVGVVGRGDAGARHGVIVGLPCFQCLAELHQVHVAVPHLVDDLGLLPVRLAKQKAVGGAQLQLAGAAFGRGGEQAERDVRPVDFVVEVLHLAQGIGGIHHAGGGDIDVLFGRDGHVEQHREGQLAQGVAGVADSGLVGVVEGGGERSVTHVQRLAEVAHVLARQPPAVHFQVHVQQVEAVEEVAHPAPAVLVIRAGQHHALHLKWLRRRHHAQHAIGHRGAVVVARVHLVGADAPRVGRGLGGSGAGW